MIKVFIHVTCTPSLITLKVSLRRRITIRTESDYFLNLFWQWLYSVIIPACNSLQLETKLSVRCLLIFLIHIKEFKSK